MAVYISLPKRLLSNTPPMMVQGDHYLGIQFSIAQEDAEKTKNPNWSC